MTNTREQVIHLLSKAAELEHNLLCSYLYAAFSLRKGPDEGLSEREAGAVQRWRHTIMNIVVQEMSHLAIVNNLLVAVGDAPHFDRPNLPVAPGYHPARIIARLTPFDEATLDHFIFLERPDGSTLQDGQGFTPEVDHKREGQVIGLPPHRLTTETVGEFYSSIRNSLLALSTRLGDATLLGGRIGAGQLGPELIDLPGLTRITDLASALSAIDMVVEEGEGSTSESHDSHFARFSAIKHEWAELKALNPAFQPAHPAAYDPVMRRPADLRERAWITDARAVQHLDLANAL
jgi:hypothetical protein